MSDKFKENVKRLYEQAAAQCSEGSAWEWELKFAELIVQECATIAKKEQEWNDTHEIKVNIDQCILCDFGL